MVAAATIPVFSGPEDSEPTLNSCGEPVFLRA